MFSEVCVSVFWIIWAQFVALPLSTTGYPPQWFSWATISLITTNPEEIQLGTGLNINLHALTYIHTKFGAFVRSV